MWRAREVAQAKLGAAERIQHAWRERRTGGAATVLADCGRVTPKGEAPELPTVGSRELNPAATPFQPREEMPMTEEQRRRAAALQHLEEMNRAQDRCMERQAMEAMQLRTTGAWGSWDSRRPNPYGPTQG